MNKKRVFPFFMIVIAFLFCLIPAKSAQAANPTTVTLRPGKTYTAYDVTGDKKPDTIKIVRSGAGYGMYKNAAVYINGKKAYGISNNYYYTITAKLYTLKNGKPFLYLFAAAENGDGPVCSLFRYKSGKLSTVINFQTVLKKYGGHLGGSVVSVSGNKIKVRFSIMSWSLGPCNIDCTYTYKSGTLKRTSNTATYSSIYAGGRETRTFTANKSITVYKSAGSSAKSFTLKKGNKVTIKKCWFSGGKMYIKVTRGNKSGWIKAASSYPRTNSAQQFSNVTYAG